jgi:phage tail tube protein FII
MYVYTMEAVNLICGDNDQGESQPGHATYLTLRQLQLPKLEENYVEHVAGGSVMAFEVFTHMNRLEATFTLAGIQPRVIGLLGRGNSSRAAQRYTAHGVVREQRTGKPMKATAILWGRLGSASPSAFRRGDLLEHEFAIKGISHYELLMEEVTGTVSQLIYWDYFTNALVVDGVDVYGYENGMLGISADLANSEAPIAGAYNTQ